MEPSYPWSEVAASRRDGPGRVPGAASSPPPLRSAGPLLPLGLARGDLALELLELRALGGLGGTTPRSAGNESGERLGCFPDVAPRRARRTPEGCAKSVERALGHALASPGVPPPEPRAITAILVGATGLVGSAILRLALAEPRIGAVVVLARRSTGAASPKLREHLVDFEAPATFTGLLRGDVLFSALGTTVRAAGSREAQYRVDHDAQLRIAAAARRNGVPALVLVSAAGASSASPFFYARMKGLLERDVVKLGFERTRLLRPGLLEGERAEVRRGEKSEEHTSELQSQFHLVC